MKLLLLSYHINDVGVEGLSRLTIPQNERVQYLTDLKNRVCASEIFYLATCNRVEYLLTFQENISESAEACLPEMPRRTFSDLPGVLRHLLGVALSKDSVVFGESQIMGQIKESLQWHKENHFVQKSLCQILDLTLREAKSIRSQVGLSHCHTSVSTVAGKILLPFLKNTPATQNESKSLLFVGASETNVLMAKYLAKRDFKNFVWVNRTDSKAQDCAKNYGGVALLWSDFLSAKLPNTTAICVATNSTEVLVHRSHLLATKPKVVADLSVPPNADKTQSEACQAEYLGLDSIRERLKADQNLFQEIVQELSLLIESSVHEVASEIQFKESSRWFADAIRSTEDMYDQFLRQALDGEFSNLSTAQQEALSHWGRKLVRKITHEHLKTFKSAIQKPDGNSQ